MEPMPITEKTLVTETVQASPARCFDVATDLASYPTWAPAISSVEITETDASGRPLEATFEAEAMGRQASYRLRYDYAGAPAHFSWHQLDGTITRRLDGAYSFEPSPDNPESTLVTYQLDVELAVSLPGFVKRRAEAKILSAALDQFRRRAESG